LNIEHMFDTVARTSDFSAVSPGVRTTGEDVMGRNAAIKRFRMTRAGQPLQLFGTESARLPVLLEMRSSPWVVRTADLISAEGSFAVKRRAEPIVVEWNAQRQVPAAFERAHRRSSIDAVLQSWVIERAWWDPRRRLSKRYWRVFADGGLYDLAFDRQRDEWLLVGIED
jgi:hypothetical protein